MKTSKLLTKKWIGSFVLLITFFISFTISAGSSEIEQLENKYKYELQKEISKMTRFFKFQGNAAKKTVPAQSSTFSTTTDFELGIDQDEDQPEEELELSRVNLLVGAFTELDLKILDLTIQPYVEFRFEKR